MLSEWIDFFLHWITLPLGIVLAFEGTRKLVSSGYRHWDIALLLIGVTMLLAFSGMFFYADHLVSTAFNESSLEFPEIGACEPSDPQLATKSELLAMYSFSETGALTEYYLEDCSEVLYQPDEQVIRQRVERAVDEAKIQVSSDFLTTKGWIFLIGAITAVALGVVLGREERRR